MERHLSTQTAIFVALFAAHRLIDSQKLDQTIGGVADRLATRIRAGYGLPGERSASMVGEMGADRAARPG